MTIDELKRALVWAMETCKKQHQCEGCPLCEGICIMNVAAYEGEMRCPEDWDIDDWKEQEE